MRGVWLASAVVWALAARAADISPRILRQIPDPHTGRQWLLVPNEENPAGPARLVSVPGQGTVPRDGRISAFVIHPGDKIVVEEHSAAVDAYLEATALEAAPVGGRLKVRLKIGGKVVKAVALRPGRAEVEP